ncbi:MAG TPA: sugar phosphate nucleotidyltransferase [Planctomycetota bacterium]|nr:sugar phosphate nucleotidyltransferase [Planctomycetota bacterium]HRR81544.1 sugar phosphate nucleotidyltransferase [Planctomycetota bacterium]HRT97344.1 sugar phosphate nucleotidyltransferase [Planctomycetota bacterium]
MKAVILAGGPEVPKCPLSVVRPKALFPLIQDVIVGRLLRALHNTDVDEAIICANGKTRVLKEHFLRTAPDLLSLAFSDDELPRGAAGCLKDAEGFIGGGSFLVVESSLFLDGGIRELVERHRAAGAAMTIAAVPAWEGRRDAELGGCGVPLAPLGVYVAEPEVLDRIPSHGYFDLKEQLVPKLRAAGADVLVSQYRGRYRVVAHASSYASLVQELLDGELGLEDFAGLREVERQVWVTDSAQVASSAVLVGPVVVGAGAVIEAEAVVAGPSLVGEQVGIGTGAFVSGSILWPGCRIGAGASVERSIVTDHFRVAEMARLSHSVAVDTSLRVGEARGFDQRGYLVRAQGTPAAVAEKPRGLRGALSGLWRGLRGGGQGGRDQAPAETSAGEELSAK